MTTGMGGMAVIAVVRASEFKLRN